MSCIDNDGAAVGGAAINTCLHKVMLGLDDSIGSGLHRVIERAFLLELFGDRFVIWDGGICHVGRKRRMRSKGR